MPPADDAHRLPTDSDRGLLLIISGPSGVGKTTITRAVERNIPGAVFSVSMTTRARTAADAEGVDYFFVTPEEFDRRAEAGEFLETAVYAGNKYGTPRAAVEAQLRRGRLMILEIDVQGARQIKPKMPHAFSLFILPPSEATLLQRLRDRKRDSEEAIQRRFDAARREIAEAHSCGVYDHFIVNDVLDRATAEALSLVRARLDAPRT
jgi:guanylate kinase